ncbi:MAG TPA: alpha-glucosidase, partial [Clostridiales bacterium]|nr:alpha-glucosidase [Clostridiales bacterium]
GYSWNKELFPDYKRFLRKVKDRNLKITLNLHPALGIRWFEDCYKDFATAMGIDPESQQVIKFDLTNEKFI